MNSSICVWTRVRIASVGAGLAAACLAGAAGLGGDLGDGDDQHFPDGRALHVHRDGEQHG